MKSRPRRFFLYLVLRTGMFVVRLLPRRAALVLAAAAGRLAYHLMPRQRLKMLANLRCAYGEAKSDGELAAVARKVFENLAMTACDCALFDRLNADALRGWVEFDDEFERVNRVLDGGKGILILTGHLGNWELLAAAFGIMGYPGAVVGRRIYYEKYNQLIVDMRERVHIRTLYRDSSPKDMLKVLKANQILGMLADQDVDSVEGVFVDFFGRPAYTPTAPVKLALATEAPIVPAFMIRQGFRYRLMVGEPIRPEMKSSREETVREYTERWSAVVENYIRNFPEQWVWMHNRWKTNPPGAPAARTESEPVLSYKGA